VECGVWESVERTRNAVCGSNRWTKLNEFIEEVELIVMNELIMVETRKYF
jgi:hypothetical protein